MDFRFPVLESGFPVVDSGFQVMDSRFPSSGFQIPSSGFRIPSSGFRISSSGFQIPSSGFRLPTSSILDLYTSEFADSDYWFHIPRPSNSFRIPLCTQGGNIGPITNAIVDIEVYLWKHVV